LTNPQLPPHMESRRVFIRNLPRSYTSDQLFELFSGAGQVADECFVSSNANLSGRFGFVQFVDVDSARRAIERFNGYEIAGQGQEGGLTVEFAKGERQASSSGAAEGAEGARRGGRQKKERAPVTGEPTPSRRIFIHNLPRSFTSDQLFELFSAAGEIADECFVSSNRRLSGRFGFVEFVEAASAACAIEKYNGHVIDGQGREGGLTVEYARGERQASSGRAAVAASGESAPAVGGRGGRSANAARKKTRAPAEEGAAAAPATPSERVFIRNLPRSITQEQLQELFAPAGEITNAFVSSNSRLSGRFGFVQYVGVPEATRAIERFHGHQMEGQGREGGLTVEFAKLQ